MKRKLQTGRLPVRFSNHLLREITPREKGKFYVEGREVSLTYPSSPIDYTVELEPDTSREQEDRFSSREVIRAIVQQCANQNRRYLGKNRGFYSLGI